MNATATDDALSVVAPPPLPATASTAVALNTADNLLAIAMQRGASIEQMERLWALKVQAEAYDAQKAFVQDMAEFKKNPPEIVKRSHVNFTTQKGTTDYMHASHYDVTSAIVAGLSSHGFTHRWMTEQSGGKMVVTCIITHRLGHSESTRLEASPDDTGGKNAIQAAMSAKTYLERHTLLAATGLSTRDQQDDDGRGAGGALAAVAEVTDTIFDGLLTQLKATTSDRAAADLWKTGSMALAATKNYDAFTQFKEEVAAHRHALKAGGPK